MGEVITLIFCVDLPSIGTAQNIKLIRNVLGLFEQVRLFAQKMPYSCKVEDLSEFAFGRRHLANTLNYIIAL